MGKSVASTATTLKDLARLLSSSPSERLQRVRPRHSKPPLNVVKARSETRTRQSGGGGGCGGIKVESSSSVVKTPKMNINWETQQQPLPLAQVVSDCVQRWFQDTLREAKNGDKAMEILVGQMYLSGYGVPRDEKKGHAWIKRAATSRSSAWKVMLLVILILTHWRVIQNENKLCSNQIQELLMDFGLSSSVIKFPPKCSLPFSPNCLSHLL